MCKLLAHGALLALILTPVIASSATAPTMAYANDRLTVHAAQAPVGECLHALQTATGAELRGKVPSEGSISIELEAVPLHEALGRMFGQTNFAITYRSDGRAAAIELLGGPLPSEVTHQAVAAAASPAPAPDGAPWPSDPASVQAVATLSSFLQRNPSVDLPDGLAKTLGARTVPYVDLLRAAATNDDRAVRARAWRLSIRTVHEDPALWGAFKTVVETAPEDLMRDFARHLLGPNAEELTRQLIARSDADMRVPARSMLAQLQAQPRTDTQGAFTP
jgi:hypothetical protein